MSQLVAAYYKLAAAVSLAFCKRGAENSEHGDMEAYTRYGHRDIHWAQRNTLGTGTEICTGRGT